MKGGGDRDKYLDVTVIVWSITLEVIETIETIWGIGKLSGVDRNQFRITDCRRKLDKAAALYFPFLIHFEN